MVSDKSGREVQSTSRPLFIESSNGTYVKVYELTPELTALLGLFSLE